MASIEWERSIEEPPTSSSEAEQEAVAEVSPVAPASRGQDAAPATRAANPEALHGQTAVDWIRERQETAAVERLFAVLEENQIAIAALAQAWRHTSRALDLTQAELALTREMLAAERQHHHEPYR